MKINKAIYALLLLLGCWLMIMYSGTKTVVFLLFLVLLPLCQLIFAALGLSRLVVRADEREVYCQTEGHLTKTLIIENKSAIPVPRAELLIEVRVLSGQKYTQKIAVNLAAHEVRSFLLPLRFRHFGPATMEIRNIRVYDAFGVFSVKKKLHQIQELYVYPPCYHTLEIEVSDRQEHFNEETENVSDVRSGENRSEIMEIDTYHEGDDIRNIHWKLSSKSDELIIKRFGESKDRKVHICIDTLVGNDDPAQDADQLLMALHGIIDACDRQGLEYDLCGFDGEQITKASYRELGQTFRREKGTEPSFLLFAGERKNSGINLYLSARKVREDGLSGDMTFLRLEGDGKEYPAQFYLQAKMMIETAADHRKNAQKEYLLPYHDKNRKRKEEEKRLPEKGYIRYQTLLCVLGSFLAAYSIFDVVYIPDDFIPVLIVVLLSAAVHEIPELFRITFFANDRRFYKYQGILVFAGYLFILYLGDFTFLKDGTEGLIGLFRENITVTPEEYGFLNAFEDDITWLLYLITYALVDVMYHYSVEFFPVIPLLVVTPLLCVSLIVGSLPPAYAVFGGCLYFTMLFATGYAMGYGKAKSKSYLTDDYEGTRKIAVQSGVRMAVLAAVLLALINTGVNRWYERPKAVSRLKEKINEWILGERFYDGEDGENAGGEKGKTGLENMRDHVWGSLNDTVAVEHKGKETLHIVTTGNPGPVFYLKSYAGTVYTGKSWEARPEGDETAEERWALSEAYRQALEQYQYGEPYGEGEQEIRKQWLPEWTASSEDMPDITQIQPYFSKIFTRYQAKQEYVRSLEKPQNYHVEVQNMQQGDLSVYQPYYAIPAGELPFFDSDGYLSLGQAATSGQTIAFDGLRLDDVCDETGVRKKYGEYPYESEDGKEDASLQILKSTEAAYAGSLGASYLEVPENLKDVMAPFREASIYSGGQQLQLISGDRQYEAVGYEPYIQYVRQYFEDQHFQYNLSVVRKNNDEDFVEEFMTRKTGYCIHFASAAVMMFRTMGIPARYVEGYYVSYLNRTKTEGDRDYYTVTDESAHAWVEIYEEGFGWVPVEVTPENQRYTVRREEPKESPEETTTIKKNNIQETTTNASKKKKQVKKEKETTVKQQETENTPRARGVRNAKKTVQVLGVLLLLTGLFIMRYEYMRKRTKRRLSGEKREAVGEVRRELEGICELYRLPMEKAKTLGERAAILAGLLSDFDKQRIYQVLLLLDKYQYAPAEQFTKTDQQFLEEFLGDYGRKLYDRGTKFEKFMYRYIKCLYLSDK